MAVHGGTSWSLVCRRDARDPRYLDSFITGISNDRDRSPPPFPKPEASYFLCSYTAPFGVTQRLIEGVKSKSQGMLCPRMTCSLFRELVARLQDGLVLGSGRDAGRNFRSPRTHTYVISRSFSQDHALGC